jgi:hypothetical protein
VSSKAWCDDIEQGIEQEQKAWIGEHGDAETADSQHLRPSLRKKKSRHSSKPIRHWCEEEIVVQRLASQRTPRNSAPHCQVGNGRVPEGRDASMTPWKREAQRLVPPRRCTFPHQG